MEIITVLAVKIVARLAAMHFFIIIVFPFLYDCFYAALELHAFKQLFEGSTAHLSLRLVWCRLNNIILAIFSLRVKLECPVLSDL